MAALSTAVQSFVGVVAHEHGSLGTRVRSAGRKARSDGHVGIACVLAIEVGMTDPVHERQETQVSALLAPTALSEESIGMAVADIDGNVGRLHVATKKDNGRDGKLAENGRVVEDLFGAKVHTQLVGLGNLVPPSAPTAVEAIADNRIPILQRPVGRHGNRTFATVLVGAVEVVFTHDERSIGCLAASKPVDDRRPTGGRADGNQRLVPRTSVAVASRRPRLRMIPIAVILCEIELKVRLRVRPDRHVPVRARDGHSHAQLAEFGSP